MGDERGVLMEKERIPMINRPLKDVAKVRQKLYKALSSGISVEDSLNYAGITQEDYEHWCEVDEELATLHVHAKQNLTTQARINVADEIKRGNAKISLTHLKYTTDDYVEKKKVQVGAPIIVPIDKKEEEFAEFMERFGNE